MATKFLIQEGIRNILRNKSAFILSASVSAICLLLLSIFLVLTVNILRAKNYFEERIEIYAFLYDNADANDLINKISLLSGVRQVQYVSKAQALKELKNDLGDNAQLLDILGHNPLPAGLRIQIEPNYKLASRLSELEEKIRLLRGVRETWSGKDILVRLQRIIRIIIGLDAGILLIVFIAVVFIISRTVESTILARSREIEIMRLVGASSNMVKFPFYIEGLSHGLLGSIISFIIMIILFYIVAIEVPMLSLPIFSLLIFNVIAGSFLGLSGSYIALSHVLK
ncbi:MAG: permease-like cell division protein FtsX [candidate division WOR-3 bacterium]|nr:permease-like cell division protein FtsX [candidate division WOR-3 bacterium]